MFITKHLLALVALPVGAASSCDVCSKKLYEFSQCGFFNQEAKGKFDDWKYPTIANQTIGSDDCHSDHCCASDKDDCCEANVGAIVGLVVAIVLFVAMCCYQANPYSRTARTTTASASRPIVSSWRTAAGSTRRCAIGTRRRRSAP